MDFRQDMRRRELTTDDSHRTNSRLSLSSDRVRELVIHGPIIDVMSKDFEVDDETHEGVNERATITPRGSMVSASQAISIASSGDSEYIIYSKGPIIPKARPGGGWLLMTPQERQPQSHSRNSLEPHKPEISSRVGDTLLSFFREVLS